METGDDTFDQRIASQLDALDNLCLDSSAKANIGVHINESAQGKSATVFNINEVSANVGVDKDMPKVSNNRSCDDLLDLTSDQTETERKIVGKNKGTQSDEVRIMEKVLGPKVCIFYSFLIEFR